MRKLLAALILMISSQLTVWASDYVIVELAPNARASAVAAALGGQVLDSIPGGTHYLMKVPSAAALANNPQLGVVNVELNDAVTLKPGNGLGILKTAASSSAEWYAKQPSFQR